jgi:hypothetical protein
MKRTLSFLFFFSLFVAACSPSAATPTEATAIENTPQPALLLESTPISTLTAEAPTEVQPTATNIPTIAPSTTIPGQPNAIQFAANGTYTDIADSIATGGSKTYSVNAMKGQIMSVSVLPQVPDGNWRYVYLNIKGADGSVLCPQAPDTACMFWRGVLPSSQDYFITLTIDSDMSALQFVMRVAINPPGEDVQYFQYANPASGISLTYPDTFAPAIPVYGNYKISPELTLHLIDSRTYEKTNLSEAYLLISSTSDSQIVATCTKPNESGGGPEQIIGNEVINGITFVHSALDGAGAGNYYHQEIYRMTNQDVCYEVIYFIHSTNIGNYPPGTVTEFDSNTLMQKLYSVFSTFTIK